MWELIRANRRKSMILLFLMAALLITVGYFVGETYNPDGGGVLGVLVAVCIWTFMSLISYYAGDSIILLSSRAHEVSKEVHPQLYNVVEEMKIAANLHAMPKIYIIDEVAPNAFATGRNPKSSSIAVTAGLLNRLNRDELQGVVAHEMSHIMNRDVMFVTFAGVLVGSIVLLSDVFLRSLWFGGSSRRYRSGKGVKGGSNPTIMIIAIVLTIISPIIAQLLYFAISRKREYLADASAARLTRYPEGLASALEEIADNNIELVSANKITAPMYIVNPMVLKEGMRLADLSSTHPPISERIAILRKMAGGADYEHYQRAFGAVKGKRYSIIPPSGIRTSTNIPIRQPSEAKKKDRTKKQQQRDLGDLMRAINQYLFLVCACGLKIKIPPDFKEDKITCPKCSRVLEVPLGQLTAATAAMAAGAGSTDQRTLHVQEEEMQTYNRIGDGWETVVCKCGMPNQLSPAFRGAHITCRNCNRRIIIQR